VFSDGSFCFIPAGVRCPMELSTYFRINAAQTGQFERTLIVAEEGASVSYLEGCTAPDARREPAARRRGRVDRSKTTRQIKYSTVQNWYPGDADGKGGIYNFVTKRGRRAGTGEDLLDPGRDRFGDHLEVPERDPAGRRLGRRVLLGGGDHQPSAGRHRHEDDPHRREHAQHDPVQGHLGRQGPEHLPGLVKILRSATGARNHTQCDSLLIGSECGAHTFPYIEVKNDTAQVEHEASTSKIDEDQLFYCRQRGLDRGGRHIHDRQRLLPRACSTSSRWNSPSRHRH
jgi:Fe-S cluster assembly protein SufB